MASKAKAELEKVWDQVSRMRAALAFLMIQVKRGSDEEVKALANLAMGKSEVELALQAQDSGRLGMLAPPSPVSSRHH